MPTISRNKPARTEAQMFPLVENWLRSNLTQKEYSIQQGLSPHVLPYWINRYRQQAQLTLTNQESATVETVSSLAPASFIRLDSPPVNTPLSDAPPATPSTVLPETTAMAVELPSGVVLRFPSLIPISYLQEVVTLCSR